MTGPTRNEKVLEAVRAMLTADQFNGQVVLHCQRGVVQKIEKKDFQKPDEMIQRYRGG